MFWPFLVTVLAPVVAGLISGRWIVIPLAALPWPVLYTGLRYEWWGNGVGDGWQLAGVLFALSTMALTAVAVFLSRMVRRAGREPAMRPDGA